MKTIKIFIILIISIYLGSCEENGLSNFDIYDNQTIVNFEETQDIIFYNIDDPETYSKEISIGVNTLSDRIRNIHVSVSNESTAPSNMYTLTQDVSIPVNEFSGKLIITGVAENMDATGKFVLIQIDSIDVEGAIISEDTFKVTLVRIN